MLLQRCRQVCLGQGAFNLDSLGTPKQAVEIDPDRLSLLNELFELIDANGNGTLDREELGKVMVNAGMFLQLVHNGRNNTSMGKDAFVTWAYLNVVRSLSEDKVQRMTKLLKVVAAAKGSSSSAVFDGLDLNRDKELALSEFQLVLGAKEALLFSTLLQQINTVSPVEKEGSVTKDEFALWATSKREEYKSFVVQLLDIRAIVTTGVFALFDKVVSKVHKVLKKEREQKAAGAASSNLAPAYSPAVR
jgi:hypothetical protein